MEDASNIKSKKQIAIELLKEKIFKPDVQWALRVDIVNILEPVVGMVTMNNLKKQLKIRSEKITLTETKWLNPWYEGE